MSSENKRDVAKDLVDFLLNESKNTTDSVTIERTKKADNAPTTVLENVSLPVGLKPDGIKPDAIKPDAIKPEAIKTKTVPDINSLMGPKKKVVEEVPKEFSKPLMTSERGKAIYSEVSKLVGGAEAIRVAQARIQELEKERDELRSNIDELLVTSEALQRQIGETKAQLENLDKKQKQRIEISEEEKLVMRQRLIAREAELSKLKKINEEIEYRFQNDLKKIRVREKEYENKNIILKAESAAVTRAKDEMILDLKRKIDQFQFEIDNYKTKFSQTDSLINEMREREVRTVKALRLALNILETDDFEETTQVGARLKAAGDE